MKTMFNIDLKQKIILFILFFYIILTNEYYDLQESLDLKFSDSIDYYLISNKLFGEVGMHHKIRSTLLIFFSDVLNFNDYGFRFIVFIVIILIIFIQFLIFSSLRLNKNLIFILLILMFSNPYLFRYYIAVPYYLTDLFFIFSTQIFVLYLIKKKIYLLFFSIFFGFSREQTILYLFANNKLKFLSNTKFRIFIILLVVCCVINLVLFSSNKNIIIFDIKYLVFIFYPLLGYFPVFFFIFYISYKLELKFKMNSNVRSIIIPMLVIFFIPYFIGYELVNKNIVRLSNLSFLLLINFFILMIYQQKKITIKNDLKLIFQNKFINFIFFMILLIQSFHPTFSKIKILNFAKFTF